MIVGDLQAHFPALVQNSDSKYSIVLDQLVAQFPLFPLILRSGLTPVQALMFALLVLVLAGFALFYALRRWKRVRETRTRPA